MYNELSKDIWLKQKRGHPRAAKAGFEGCSEKRGPRVCFLWTVGAPETIQEKVRNIMVDKEETFEAELIRAVTKNPHQAAFGELPMTEVTGFYQALSRLHQSLQQ